MSIDSVTQGRKRGENIDVHAESPQTKLKRGVACTFVNQKQNKLTMFKRIFC